MKIRPAKTSDIPAITRIYADAVTHGTASFELTAPDGTRLADALARLDLDEGVRWAGPALLVGGG